MYTAVRCKCCGKLLPIEIATIHQWLCSLEEGKKYIVILFSAYCPLSFTADARANEVSGTTRQYPRFPIEEAFLSAFSEQNLYGSPRLKISQSRNLSRPAEWKVLRMVGDHWVVNIHHHKTAASRGPACRVNRGQKYSGRTCGKRDAPLERGTPAIDFVHLHPLANTCLKVSQL